MSIRIINLISAIFTNFFTFDDVKVAHGSSLTLVKSKVWAPSNIEVTDDWLKWQLTYHLVHQFHDIKVDN